MTRLLALINIIDLADSYAAREEIREALEALGIPLHEISEAEQDIRGLNAER